MILVQIPISVGMNFSYIFGDAKSLEVAIVDPGCDVRKILKQVTLLGGRLEYIFNTHWHGDHTAGNSQIKQETGAKVVMHASAPLPKDIEVRDEDLLRLGRLAVKVIHTPGHTPDSICLLICNKLFTGDTLFVGECGKTDLPGGSSKDLYRSLFEKIFALSDDIEVYPGHNYGERTSSTIGQEKKTNYTLKRRTLEEFIQFMKET